MKGTSAQQSPLILPSPPFHVVLFQSTAGDAGRPVLPFLLSLSQRRPQGPCDSGKCLSNYMKFSIGYFFSIRHRKFKKQRENV